MYKSYPIIYHERLNLREKNAGIEQGGFGTLYLILHSKRQALTGAETALRESIQMAEEAIEDTETQVLYDFFQLKLHGNEVYYTIF